MDRDRRRALVALVVISVGAVAAVTARSTPAAHTAIRLVREYPFAASVTWNIDDTFTTTCNDKTQTVSGELRIAAQETKPALLIWVPGKAFEAKDMDPFQRSHGREAWTIQTSATVDPACAPLQTDPTACSGTWNTKKWGAVADFGTQGFDVIQPPVLTQRHTAGKPPYAWRFFCLTPPQTANFYAPYWWGDAASPIFNPKYADGASAPEPTAITDCHQRTLKIQFSDTYSQDNSDTYSENIQNEQATATVTLHRLNSGVRLAPIFASIPGWQNMKRVYGC